MEQGVTVFGILSIKSVDSPIFSTEFQVNFFRYQPPINIKKAIYQALTKHKSPVSLITPVFVNNPNSLTCKAFVFLGVKQALINEFTG